jgi:xanthine dehydrogenase YagR molybdenum-binding subunit
MDLKINGSAASADAGPDDTLVEVLRDGLGLTGTKLVCGTGVCGACTVLVDGTPAVSCLTPPTAVAGREVTTVEGLGGDSGAHPVQRAFAAHDALQCGYCTPGFVVEAAAFVDRWRAEHGDVAPDRARIAAALAGHLCRCGAYEGIYAAVAAACAGEHDAAEPADAAGAAGSPARVEAMDKITGRARYTTDIRLDGRLEGVIVRSTRAHARVEAVRGPGTGRTGDGDGDGDVTMIELLPEDRTVRYVGEPIAAVAAGTRAKALAAAARVEVTYTPLPEVLTVAAATEPGTAAVYPDAAARKRAPNSAESPGRAGRWQGNVRGPSGGGWRGRTAARRIAAARARGDRRLVTERFSTGVQVHTPLEPHACLARWDGDELHLWVSTQGVDGLARHAKRRWEAAEVHVHAEHVGGGFGAKQGVTSDVVAAVELARASGRPVGVELSREEELADGGNRPGTSTEVSMLAADDGRLAALTVDTHGDGGVAVGSSVAGLAMFMYGRAPRRLRDFDVVTNRPPGKPFRGPGAAPLLWALEQAVDETAHRLGEDPIALRRRWDGNSKRRALYDLAARLPAWRDRAPTGSLTGRFRRGVGVSAANWLYLLEPGTEVELTVRDGIVVARTGTQDIGTGTRSVVAEVVRAELGLPADRVRVEVGHSGTPRGPASAGSKSTTSVGPAASDAARRLRAELGSRAGPGSGPGSGSGTGPGSGNGTGTGTAAEGSVLAALDGADGLRVVGRRRRDRRGYLIPFPISGLQIGRGFSGAVHVTEVEVDTRLGKVRVTRVWGGISAGRIYTDRLARGQCEGGIIQGIGFALYEERLTDPQTGAVLTGGLEDYRIPGIGDSPEIDIHFHTDGWDHVTGSGVGLGEVSTVGVAASIGNAIYNATGWRPRDLPIRPDRILEGLGK